MEITSPPKPGPVSANGATSRPLRRQAAATSRPMAPGRPLTITAGRAAHVKVTRNATTTTTGSMLRRRSGATSRHAREERIQNCFCRES
eukprot:scaffold5868_cov120-Isochrysis_galbana.AAC.5